MTTTYLHAERAGRSRGGAIVSAPATRPTAGYRRDVRRSLAPRRPARIRRGSYTALEFDTGYRSNPRGRSTRPGRPWPIGAPASLRTTRPVSAGPVGTRGTTGVSGGRLPDRSRPVAGIRSGARGTLAAVGIGVLAGLGMVWAAGGEEPALAGPPVSHGPVVAVSVG